MSGVRTCRVCGCTDARACDGGCRWVGDDICSTCDPVATRRQFLVEAMEEAGYAIGGLADLYRDPTIIDRKHPCVDDEVMLDNTVDNLVRALQQTLAAIEPHPNTSGLAAALAAYLDRDTDAEDAGGVRGGFPLTAGIEGNPMTSKLSLTAQTSICTVLAALVNAGGVRDEDLGPVNDAMAALKTELETDESTLADHEARITALEDLANGEAEALDPNASSGSASSSGTAETDPSLDSSGGTSSALGAGGDDGSAVISGGTASSGSADEVQTGSIAPASLT